MSIYKLYGTSTGGSENGIGALDIVADGTIRAVSIDYRADLDADDEFIEVEISFGSSNTVQVNDTRQSIFSARKQTALLTSGVYDGQISGAVSGLNIPVIQGERVFLHVNATAGVLGRGGGYMYVEDSLDTRLRRRR